MIKNMKKRPHTVRFTVGVSLDRAAILRCLGIPAAKRGEYWEEVKTESPVMAEKLVVLQNMGNEILKVYGLYKCLPFCREQRYDAAAGGPAPYLAVPMLLTLGNTYETGKEKLDRKDMLSQWIWEATGNAALMETQEWFAGLLQKANKSDRSIEYWAPGDGKFPLETQKAVFDSLNPATIGVALNDHYNIEPAKTLTGVFIIREMKETSGRKKNNSTHNCRQCHRADCFFRKA